MHKCDRRKDFFDSARKREEEPACEDTPDYEEGNMQLGYQQFAWHDDLYPVSDAGYFGLNFSSPFF